MLEAKCEGLRRQLVRAKGLFQKIRSVSRSASQPRPQHHAPIHTLQLPVLNKHDLVVGMMCAGGSWPPPGLGPGCWRGRRRRR